ncbi:MAG: NADH-quinone oxidoreductase subunit N, partial [Spirochaetia bacterium]|nr:NADH-quinone oxidoreductase subunit N [Spirochaetia bacterium]
MIHDLITQSMAILPEIILAAGLIAVLTLSLFNISFISKNTGWISLLFYALSLYFLFTQNDSGFFFSRSVYITSSSVFFRILIILTGAAAAILAEYSSETKQISRPELNLLIMGSVLGGMFMTIASNMITLYLSIEFISLLSYLLTGITFQRGKSLEAAVKYAIYGGVSSGIMLFGMSFLYGITGSIYFDSLLNEIQFGSFAHRIMLITGTAFFIAGLGYKLAAVPFHTWCPDVYEGASVPVTYFFIAPRIAGFAVILQVFNAVFQQNLSGEFIFQAIAVLSALTMTLGNFSALNQTGIKRLLAYSSIAHGGYALALFSVTKTRIDPSLVYYMAAYFLMTGGTFIIFQILSEDGEGDLSLFNGLAFRGKGGVFLSAVMAGFAFSLIGIPPFSGFMGKYLIFAHLIEDGNYWLAVTMGFNTILSIYYYMKFLHHSYFFKSQESKPVSIPIPVYLILA